MLFENIVQDLITCNVAIKWMWRWKKLFYALKDYILQTYGVFVGYDLQIWEDQGYFEFDLTGEIDVIAEHRHILKRYVLGDRVFHIPTDEFSYFNFEYQDGKESENYRTLYQYCLETINGKKEYKSDDLSRADAWKALKRLVARFGSELRVKPQMEMPF